MRFLHLLVLLLLMVIVACNIHNKGKVSKRRSVAKRSLSQAESLRPLRRTKRRWVLTTIVLEENDPGPFPKVAGDLFNDRAANMSIKYLISGPGVDEFPEFGLFSIDDLTGQVFVHRPIDRERTPIFMVCFDAADRLTGNIVDKSLIFNVEIKDKNDNAPEFAKKEYNIGIKETFNLANPIIQVIAIDSDLEDTPNSEVIYSMISQIPSLPDVSFSIDPKNGLIRGSGCLNYEGNITGYRLTWSREAGAQLAHLVSNTTLRPLRVTCTNEKCNKVVTTSSASLIKLIVRARDNGQTALSSTTTVVIRVEDGNNNMPVIKDTKYELTVPEGEMKNDILRIKVEDKDVPKTPAWRAQFKILSGNEKEHFNVTTDPNTNEGILSIVKPLDFEGASKKDIVIAVANEESFYSCQKPKARMETSPISNNVTVRISVEDANDAPIITPARKVIREKEGLKPGSVLFTVNATDPDVVKNKIRYKIASDPAGLVTVDENTGLITTVKELDRESPYVNQTLYTFIVHAVDDGIPPQTGTSTVLLYISDVNDNTPRLLIPYIERCVQGKNTQLMLQAEDKDMDPYAGPFKFELADESRMKDSWRIGRSLGNSAELSFLKNLSKGNYSVPLKIYDRQGIASSQTLNVRVCSCPDGNTCEKLQPAAQSLGGAAIGVIFAALLLFLLVLCLLMCFFCASGSKKRSVLLPNDEGNQTLIKYNEEGGSALSQATPAGLSYALAGNGNTQNIKDTVRPSPSIISQRAQYESWERDGVGMSPAGAKRSSQHDTWTRDSVGVSPAGGKQQSQHETWTRAGFSNQAQNGMWKQQGTVKSQVEKTNYTMNSKYMNNGSLRNKSHDGFADRIGEMVNKRLQGICVDDDSSGYKPRVYAYEGDLERFDTMDSFSIPESDSDLGFLDELDPKFAKLEEICRH